MSASVINSTPRVGDLGISSPCNTMELVRTELFDVNAMQNLLNHDGVLAETKKQLRAYFKKAYNGNEVEVIYQHGKKSDSGRLYPKNGLGLAGMWRDARNALAAKYYHDIDIVNSHPTLINNIAEKAGLRHEYLQDYIDNREQRLAELGEGRDENKQRVLALFYGSQNTNGFSPFWVKCYEDIQRIMKHIFNNADEADIKRSKKDKPDNVVGSTCSYYMQREELKVLNALDKALGEQGRKLAVLIHDGGLVKRLADEPSFPPEVLQRCEIRIKELTKYEIRLAVKPMVTTFAFPKEEVDDYVKLKKEFELTHFKLLQPYTFIRMTPTGTQDLSSADIRDMYLNKTTSDGKKFIPRWLEDPDLRTYDRLGYYPNPNLCPANEFNTFIPFAVTSIPPNTEEVNIDIIFEQMKVLVNFDASHYLYILKYIAFLFQRPEIKPCICLAFNGSQGTGKDSFWEFIGRLLGAASYFNSTDAQNDMFGSFNALCASKKLIKMEETSCSVLNKYKEVLKTKITQSSGNYNQKNVKMKTLQSFEGYVITTNEAVPFLTEDTDRRFVLFTPSDKYIRNSNPLLQEKNDEYWSKLHATYTCEKAQRAFYDYIMSVDLSDFNILNKPTTTSSEFVRLASRPNHAKFMQCRIQSSENADLVSMSARDLWNEFNTWNKEQGYHTVSDSRFGLDIKDYIESNAIEKIRRNTGVRYTVYPDRVQSFLQKKKWWNEEM